MTKVIPHQYQLRRGQTGKFDGDTFLLKAGEPFVEYKEDKTIVGLKIGDGLHVYNELPYLDADTQTVLHEVLEEMKSLKQEISNAGDYTYFITRKQWDSHDCDDLQMKISYFLHFFHNEAVSVLGNLFVIREEMYEDAQLDIYEIYVYTGEKDGWVKIHGHELPADKIIFKEDIVYTEAVGALEVPAETGHGVLSAKGQTVAELFKTILCRKRLPNVNPYTVNMDVKNVGSFEVGSRVTPSYTVNFDPGSYQYYPYTTGAQIYLNSVKLGDLELSDKSMSGNFGQVEIHEDTNYRLTVNYSVKVNRSIAPRDNLGGYVPELRLSDSTGTLKSSSYLRGYRGIFCGYKKNSSLDFFNIQSSDIRGLCSTPFQQVPSTIATEKMKQLVVAIPAERMSGMKVTIINSENNSPQRVNVLTNVMVEGKDGYSPIPYNVYWVENKIADTKNNTYKITVEKEG